MSRSLRVGDLARVTNRVRRGTPSHGDIGKIISVQHPQMVCRAVKAGDGSMTEPGAQFVANINDLQLVEPETQIQILREMVMESQRKIMEEQQKITSLHGRIEWLESYGTEENALVHAMYDVIKGSSSKEEALAKAINLTKGKFSFI